MKQIKLRSIMTNSENETTNVETIGNYFEETKTITYKEEDLFITINIFEDSIKILRKNEDYNLNLEFKLSKKINCNYEVKSVGLNINLLVITNKLEIKDKYIYIHYDLFNEENYIGNFEYKLIFWE